MSLGGRAQAAIATVLELWALSRERVTEELRAGLPETEERIEELRRRHGRALRVTGQARARRARWTGQEAWLVASYPKEG